MSATAENSTVGSARHKPRAVLTDFGWFAARGRESDADINMRAARYFTAGHGGAYRRYRLPDDGDHAASVY